MDKTFALDLSCGPLFMRDKQTRIAPDQVNKDRVQVRRLASHLTPFDPNTFLFMLRACIVNFRTTLADVRLLPELIVGLGRDLDERTRPKHLRRT